jgi:PAS domain S-box-containing protein
MRQRPGVPSRNGIAARLTAFSGMAALSVAAVGLASLAGWMFDIRALKAPLSPSITIKTNAALSLLGCGLSIWLLLPEPGSRRRRRAGEALAFVVLVIAGLTLLQHIVGWNLHIDELLFTEPPGAGATASPNRMGPPASLSFALLGFGLLGLNRWRWGRHLPAQYTGIAVVLIALFSITGYLFGVSQFYAVARLTGISLHTALCLLALGLSVLSTRPEQGFMPLLCREDEAGALLRRLLAPALLLPLVIGWILSVGVRLGWYETLFAISLMTLALIAGLAALVWRAMVRLAAAVERREAAERAMRDSEARYRSLAENVPSILMRYDRQLRVVYLSPAAQDITGIPVERFLGKTSREAGMPEDLSRKWEDAVTRVFQTGISQNLEFELPAPGGTKTFVLKLAPEFGPEANIQSVLGISTDITERKRMEETLRLSEATYRRIAEANLFGVGVSDSQGHLTYVNDEMLRMMGRNRAEYEAGNVNWRDCLAPECRDQPASWTEILTRKRKVVGYELAFMQPDGTRTPYLGATVLVGKASDLRVSIALDLTDIKQAHERLKVAKDEAEHANRSKDEFLAVLSHELRTPIAAILGWVRLLKDDRLDPPAAKKAIEIIERNVYAQMRLIEDLLDISRIIAGKLTIERQLVDIVRTTHAAVEALTPLAEAKSVHLRWNPLIAGGTVEGDGARLQQVVSNLVTNAIKFTPAGGFVEVSVEARGGTVALRVRDTGHGITPDFLPALFQRFRQKDSTTSRKYMGLGLGLAITQSLVSLHGGSIRAHSDGEGQGAMFEVNLPLAERPTVAVVDAEFKSGTLSLDGIKVLLVEDSTDLRDLLEHALRIAGAEVAAVSSASEAIGLLEGFHPDILVSDIGLPGEDGFSLLSRIRALEALGGLKPIPAVALTGYAQTGDVERCRAAGFQRHLPKPLEPDELVACLRTLSTRVRNHGDVCADAQKAGGPF